MDQDTDEKEGTNLFSFLLNDQMIKTCTMSWKRLHSTGVHQLIVYAENVGQTKKKNESNTNEQEKKKPLSSTEKTNEKVIRSYVRVFSSQGHHDENCIKT